MNRTFTAAQLFCAAAAFVSVATSLASAQLNVVVDDDNHFVLQSESFHVLGIQLESASGSLVPSELSDTGPFDISLMKNPMVVMFGSLGRSVRVEGELKLPTQWNPGGQKDVGFRWGSPTDEGAGAVAGHVAQFVTPGSNNVTAAEVAADVTTPEINSPEPNAEDDSDITIGLVPSEFFAVSTVDEDLPIQGGQVASISPVIFAADESTEVKSGNTSSIPAFVLPGYIGLDVAADPLLAYLAWDPQFDTLTVSSANALLRPVEAVQSGVTVLSQSESSATFAFDDQLADGGYELPLSWLGDDVGDISLTISPTDENVLLEVLGDDTFRLIPEPSAMTLLLPLSLAVPFLRRRRQR